MNYFHESDHAEINSQCGIYQGGGGGVKQYPLVEFGGN